MVTPVVLGLALALPHRGVIALDGDGSILLNLGTLSTVGNYAPPNLMSIIFDNESYASTGGLPTATAGNVNVCFPRHLTGCGFGPAKKRGLDDRVQRVAPEAEIANFTRPP